MHRYERALRLGAAASALKEEIGGDPPAELMMTQETFDQARKGLDARTAERAWEEARAMGADKAVAYALEGAD